MANILIVDDDLDTADLSRKLLESEGHQVHIEDNGEAGLVSLRSKPHPDCILLDVDMPVLNGPEMAHAMLLHDAGEEDIPILLVSGRDDLPKIAKRMGTPYFLKKASVDYATKLVELIARAVSEDRAPAHA